MLTGRPLAAVQCKWAEDSCQRRIARGYYDEQIWDGERGEKEKQSGSLAVERDGTGDALTVKTRLMEVACTWSHVHTCAAAKGHVWVHNPIAAKVCVDIHGQCYHQRPGRCPVSGVLPKVILMFQSCAELAPPHGNTGRTSPASHQP